MSIFENKSSEENVIINRIIKYDLFTISINF